MWLMLQQDKADDYVIATGLSHSVRQLVETRVRSCRSRLAETTCASIPAFLRPAEVDHLVGDFNKAQRVLGWQPQVTFEKLIAMMVDADLARLSGQVARATVVRALFQTNNQELW
jgi:GDPmannose 4,6-dehydratase